MFNYASSYLQPGSAYLCLSAAWNIHLIGRYHTKTICHSCFPPVLVCWKLGNKCISLWQVRPSWNAFINTAITPCFYWLIIKQEKNAEHLVSSQYYPTAVILHILAFAYESQNEIFSALMQLFMSNRYTSLTFILY